MSSRRKGWPFKRHRTYESELRTIAKTWFSKKGLVTHPDRPYRLKSYDDWPQNIICAEVAKYMQEEKEKSRRKKYFPLHKDLHHGLSSQAMTFNLLGPLVVRGDFEPLRTIIEQAGIEWPTGEITAEFEYDDRTIFNEGRQPTSIDLVISGETESLFIEVKFKEQGFGGCDIFSQGDCDGRNPNVYGPDGCFLCHIGTKYWNLMNEFGFDKTTLSSGPICPFTNYYQFFREVLFSLKKEGCFILLHDERNPAFLKSGLWPLLMESVPAEHAASIRRVTIQQLVKAIDESGRHHDWIKDFRLKYGVEPTMEDFLS